MKNINRRDFLKLSGAAAASIDVHLTPVAPAGPVAPAAPLHPFHSLLNASGSASWAWASKAAVTSRIS
jgi:TAT (twin-arginine translocation) pathway signal sequence